MLRVTTSIVIDAPRDLVSEIYADYIAWPRLFPTISGVRLLRRDGEKLVLEVDHVEGKLPTSCSCDRPTTSSYGKTNAATARCSGTSFGRFPAEHDSP
jgi:hypothetical protein